jgi:hypothetical protein
LLHDGEQLLAVQVWKVIDRYGPLACSVLQQSDDQKVTAMDNATPVELTQHSALTNDKTNARRHVFEQVMMAVHL